MELHLQTPKDWDALTQSDLIYLSRLQRAGKSENEAALLLYLFHSGMRIAERDRDTVLIVYASREYRIRADVFVRLSDAMLRFVRDFRGFDPKFPEFDPRSRYFDGVSLREFFAMENNRAAYLHTGDPEYLHELARLLYPGVSGKKACEEIDDIAFMWFEGMKAYFAGIYPDYFGKAGTDEDDTAETPDMREYFHSTVRALTGGDITKTREVLESDVRTALWELNEKAREIREIKQIKEKCR